MNFEKSQILNLITQIFKADPGGVGPPLGESKSPVLADIRRVYIILDYNNQNPVYHKDNYYVPKYVLQF